MQTNIADLTYNVNPEILYKKFIYKIGNSKKKKKLMSNLQENLQKLNLKIIEIKTMVSKDKKKINLKYF